MRRAALALAALALPAAAADILSARYDAASDRIVAEIAYRGTHPDHEFTVQWGACSDASPARVVGRLVDAQGTDAAREDYRTSEEIPLAGLPCRPALVTLRLGRSALAEVFVPRHVELLGGAPARPYETIGAIEASGSPGEHRSYVYQTLRNKARALGADAVIELEERARFEPPPALPAGFDVQTGGRIYEVRGIAVRFAD